MHLKLKSLTLKNIGNYRGHTTYDGFGDDVSIKGANGTGKTTIANAISYLLTGKDMLGHTWNPKPIDVNNDTIHNLTYFLEITLFDGNEEYSIGQEIQERFDNDLKFKGNTIKHEINNTPVNSADADEFIEQWAEPATLRLLINPHALSQLNWKKRRDFLISLLPKESNFELAKSHYPELVPYLEKQGLPAFQDWLSQKRKDHTNNINECNIRMQERNLDDSDFSKSRIDNLEAAKESSITHKAQVQKLQDQVNSLIEYKIKLLEDAINMKFAPIHFKLFEQQLNGNWKETCYIMYEGRTWDELSQGERIKAGLYIIKALQRHYNFKAPVIIDEHESVAGTKELPLPELDCQVIRLYHVPEKELTIEH